MKKYGVYIMTVLVMSLLGGCSDSSHGSSQMRTIKAGEEVFVDTGDSITPDTQDTEIVVSHYLNDTKSVRVITGSVTLLSGQYDIK